MVLDITSKCKMECPHCMNSCTSDGDDITTDILDKIIAYIKDNKLRFRIVLIGGGEPTEHPNLFGILDRLNRNLSHNAQGDKIKYMIATNGMFVNRTARGNKMGAKEYIDKLLSYEDLIIQVTHDPRFYKTELNRTQLMYLIKEGGERVRVENEIRLIAEHGRALVNTMPSEMPHRESPFCFNARSMAIRNGFNFQTIVEKFENELNKFCSVCFDMYGGIRISESLECPVVGTVDTPIQSLSQAIKGFDCRECSHIRNLSQMLKVAIGL